MMRNIISFMHISLDGFVAGPKGEMDWITVNEAIFDFVGKRINQGDTALYGRKTYEMMEGYWPTAAEKPEATKHDIEHSKWYKSVHKIVLSRKLKPKRLTGTTIIADTIKASITEIKQSEGEEILLFGSPTATHALLQHNLIDGFWLFVNPILLGRGIRLFSNIEDRKKLKLLSSHQFDCGVIELNYMIEKSPSEKPHI